MGKQSKGPVGFTSREVVRLVGGSERLDYYRLNYWIKTGLIRAGVQSAHGKGTVRRFTLGDVVAVRAVLALRDAGVSLQTVRKAAAYLQSHHRIALERARLVIVPGARPDLARVTITNDTVADAAESLVKSPGQHIMAPVFSLDLEPLRREVKAHVVELQAEHQVREENLRARNLERARIAAKKYRVRQRDKRRRVAIT